MSTTGSPQPYATRTQSNLVARGTFRESVPNARRPSVALVGENHPLLAPNGMIGSIAVEPTWTESLKQAILGSGLNVLLVRMRLVTTIGPRELFLGFVPVDKSQLRCNDLFNVSSIPICIPLGVLSAKLEWPEYATFFLNFFAIIPLAGLLGFCTEEVALRAGQTIGGLINATLGNAVELIVGIFALREGLINVVQASLLGSILSNLLLVTGFCFFFGGLKYHTQSFNTTAAQTSASLMALTVFAYLIPAAYVMQASSEDPDTLKHVESLSRATAIILLIIYVCFLVFQLHTHTAIFNDTTQHHDTANDADDDEEESPTLNFKFAIVLLLIVTILISVCADLLVGSIEGLTSKLGLTQSFVGIVLLPIVGNAAEHYTAVLCAIKNKMNLAISVAVGSSMQIALMVTPFLVLLGWVLDQPLTLAFPPFSSVTIFVAVFVVNSLIQDGESNWIEGSMLLAAYCILAVAFFYIA
ncbi:hypothetical protein SmJEL517_g01812 [Synchytrium microbalum]|uniref:Vacuolar calcium ion transporter n=1 Tax=Synchytrium microbalum TaxID=1806994 RepID=A0A507CD52_9FUNG|nr:uncharacterized protein SmJEL517_g01812 [Synchytrium microbalum]TPX35976.1 hypothetical protein SmJEL517_g01812 [Synchytrium microbalum]